MAGWLQALVVLGLVGVLHVPLGHFGSHGSSDVTSRLEQDSSALEQGF